MPLYSTSSSYSSPVLVGLLPMPIREFLSLQAPHPAPQSCSPSRLMSSAWTFKPGWLKCSSSMACIHTGKGIQIIPLNRLSPCRPPDGTIRRLMLNSGGAAQLQGLPQFPTHHLIGL